MTKNAPKARLSRTELARRAVERANQYDRFRQNRLAFGEAAVEALGLGTLDDWQKKLLKSSSDRIILNCHRQSGKSTMSSIIALHKALYNPKQTVLVLAPALRQAQEFHKKVLDTYRALRRPVPARAENRLSLDLTNDSRIIALPGKEETIRGYTAHLLIVDEAARIPDELYYAVRPMLLASRGKLVLLSSPYGKQGIFYREWMEATGFDRHEIKATENPRMDLNLLLAERNALGERYFAQEYLCQFVDTEDQVFSYELLDKALDDDIEPLWDWRPAVPPLPLDGYPGLSD